MRQSPELGFMHQEPTFCEKPLSAHPISSDSAQPLLSGFYDASVGHLTLCLRVQRFQQRFASLLKQMASCSLSQHLRLCSSLCKLSSQLSCLFFSLSQPLHHPLIQASRLPARRAAVASITAITAGCATKLPLGAPPSWKRINGCPGLAAQVPEVCGHLLLLQEWEQILLVEREGGGGGGGEGGSGLRAKACLPQSEKTKVPRGLLDIVNMATMWQRFMDWLRR